MTVTIQWYYDLIHDNQVRCSSHKQKNSVEYSNILIKKLATPFLLLMIIQMTPFGHNAVGQAIEFNNHQCESIPIADTSNKTKKLKNSSRSNTQGLQTKFIFSTKENQIPKGGKKVNLRPNCKLSDAKEIAMKDPRINYFYFDRKRTCHFFSGEYSLQSSKGINTYLVAEIYDTEDEATQNKLYQELLREGKFRESVRMDPFTNGKTKKINVGFVFCDFGEKINGDPNDIERLKNQLIGKQTDGSSMLNKFIQQESKGKIELSIDVYEENGSPTWVNMIEDESTLTYKHFRDYNNLRTKVDAKINYPDHWDIVIYAFPDKATSTDTDYGLNNNWLSISQSQGKMTIDEDENSGNGQEIRHLYMNSRGYSDPILHTVTIHEVMHAFGLHDLYLGTRSYGWSIMSARHAAQHILQYEKILLRWEDIKKVCFLKRGIIDAELVPNNATNEQYQMLVFMPEGLREDYYFLEVAQLIGRTEADQNEFIQDNSRDFGLLLMMLNNQDYETITPYIYRPSPRELGGKYGGASKAVFKTGTEFNTNGIFSKSIVANDQQRIRCTVGMNANFHPGNKTNFLRDNERIVLDGFEFGINFKGQMSFGPIQCIDYNERPIDLNVGYLNGYGYCAIIDDYGQFHLVKYDEDIQERKILNSIAVPDGLNLIKGDYYLQLEEYNEHIWVSVYKDNVRQYPLLRAGYLNCNNKKYNLVSYGNVYEYRDNTWNRVGWDVKGIACDDGLLLSHLGNNVVLKYMGSGYHWENVDWWKEDSHEVSIEALLEMGISPKDIIKLRKIPHTQLYGKPYMDGIIFELSEDGSTGKICFPFESPKMNWDTAKKRCEDLGGGWYFPSKEEVKTMRMNISTGVFAGWYYWSSTEDVNDENKAWVTSPNAGHAQWTSSKLDEIYVSAVRAF